MPAMRCRRVAENHQQCLGSAATGYSERSADAGSMLAARYTAGATATALMMVTLLTTLARATTTMKLPAIIRRVLVRPPLNTPIASVRDERNAGDRANSMAVSALMPSASSSAAVTVKPDSSVGDESRSVRRGESPAWLLLVRVYTGLRAISSKLLLNARSSGIRVRPSSMTRAAR